MVKPKQSTRLPTEWVNTIRTVARIKGHGSGARYLKSLVAKDVEGMVKNGQRIPGQIAVLGIEGVGESYFAIASAPEDKEGMEFLVKKGGGVSESLFGAREDDKVQAKGPIGKGYPIDQYRGRDLILACVGSAIAPMRSVLPDTQTQAPRFHLA